MLSRQNLQPRNGNATEGSYQGRLYSHHHRAATNGSYRGYRGKTHKCPPAATNGSAQTVNQTAPRRRHYPTTLLLRLSCAILALSITSQRVHAASLDDLRASGAVGERYDGYAVVRAQGADATVQSLVDSVNAKRRSIYQERAQKQGAPAAEVGKVYALEIAGKAPRGTWFLGEDGKWTQKK